MNTHKHTRSHKLLTKARIDHTCTICKELIPAGSCYARDTLTPWNNKCNRGFLSYRAHYYCHEYWQQSGQESDWILPEEPLDAPRDDHQATPMILHWLLRRSGWYAATSYSYSLVAQYLDRQPLRITMVDSELWVNSQGNIFPDCYDLRHPQLLEQLLEQHVIPIEQEDERSN